MISFIWAQTKEGIIGKDNKLPWAIPEEMKHFRQTTRNYAIVMGRATFAGMDYKPLPNRMNYIVSHDATKYKNLYAMKDLVFIDNIKPLVEQYQRVDQPELFVIGGAQIFNLFLPYVSKLIRTTVKKDYSGDVSMIKINYNEYKKIKEIDNKDFVIEYFIKKGTQQNG